MTWLRVLAARLLGRVHRDRLDDEFDEELRFHLQMEADANHRRGLPPGEARRLARLRLGGSEGIKDECREMRGLTFVDTCIQDVRYGVRMLAKHPAFTTVAVLSLALGIGATSTIFSVLNAAVLRPLPFEEPDRLVAIREFDPERGRVRNAIVSNVLAWREQSQTLEQIALGMGGVGLTVPVSAGGGTARVQRQQVGAHLFRLLGVEPVLGRWFAAEDFPGRGTSSTVIISFGLWQQLFGGDPAALGQELTQATGQTRTIVGVMPPGFRVLPQSGTTAHHAWVGQEGKYYNSRRRQASGGGTGTVVGRLKRGVSVEQAQAELQTISRGLALDAGTEPRRVQVEPLDQWLSVEYAGTLYVLFGAVGCVLLIACLNVATLSLGRAAARRKEMATRLALGAGRWRVVRQLLTESLLLALLGGVLGVGLAVAGIKLFIALAAGWYPPTDDIQVDGTVLGFLLGLSLVTGIVSGVAPALRSSAVNLTDALKAGAQGALGGSRHRVSDVLVVSEAALALVLLVGAGLMLNSFVRLVRVDPGFQSDRLLTIRFDLRHSKYMRIGGGGFRFTPSAAVVQQQFLERIEALPEVDAVGLVSADAFPAPVSIPGRPAAARDEPFRAFYAETSPDYFRTLRIPLLKGRVFTARDASGAPVVAIINETMARQCFPGEDPIGARVQADLLRLSDGRPLPRRDLLGRRQGPVREDFIADQPRTIVGVVGDVKRSLKSDIGPLMYVPYGQHLDGYPVAGVRGYTVPLNKQLVIRTAADPLSLAGAVRAAMADVDPNLVPYNVMTMDARLADSATQEAFWMQLLGLFAGLAVALAAIGLYGVIAYAVAQRTHELGIRTALGATRTDVFTLVVRQGLVLALLGVAIGIPAAVALTRVIASRLFGVTATDPATLAAAAVLFVSIALLACSIPARRATKVDPLVALRTE